MRRVRRCRFYISHGSELRRHSQENMKELIIDIMARYEAEIRQLSETQYAGPCFKTFIRKWEMLTTLLWRRRRKRSCHPTPVCRLTYTFPMNPLTDGTQATARSRRLEAEEEQYFQTDDDDEDEAHRFSVRPPSRGCNSRRSASVVVRPESPCARCARRTSTSPHAADRQPCGLRRRDEDTVVLPAEGDAAPPTPPIEDGPPATPRLAHRQISPTTSAGAAATQTTMGRRPARGSYRCGRRNDDARDEDEPGLERLRPGEARGWWAAATGAKEGAGARGRDARRTGRRRSSSSLACWASRSRLRRLRRGQNLARRTGNTG